MPESTKKASGRKTKTKASAPKAKKKAAPGRTKKSTKAAAKPAKEATHAARKAEPAAPSTAKARGLVQIKLVRSLIGSSPHQRAVVAGLGLRRLNQIVERRDTREVRGMVAKVPHLVNILP